MKKLLAGSKKFGYASIFIISLFTFSGLRFASADLLKDISSDSLYNNALATAVLQESGNDKDDNDSGSNTNVNNIGGTSAFGFNDWDFLQKVNTNQNGNQTTNTDTDIGLSVTGGGNVNNGTFSMTPSLVTGYSDLMIALKQATSFNLYLIPTSATSGFWTSSMVGNGNGLSHFSVYGRGSSQVPEPSLSLLIGISLSGIVGAGAVRKIKQKKVVNSC
ncbi:hypothetical protein SCALIN_C03_0022 [Candidatus Scalindua japonica]|uniref:PEP-CTERM protein-sorting domain-containing protein n=1 Tax=Candidatus Scalindua japonica TaxID=1284222 RepID=A0A286TU32_9BACT|nr:hypothetical protein [Candidatus Scalindua japonica]GAX59365.1 hypothetical protein SCALIN_C03_0022 [Candidatus Scalindua japonica]